MKKTILILALLSLYALGAQDFEDISPSNTFNTDLRSVDVLSNSNMVISGTSNKIYLTDQNSNILAKNSVSVDDYVNLHKVTALSDEKYIAISYSDKLFIFDSELEYTSVTIDGEILTDIDFVNESTGFISTAKGNLYVSNDGGNSWTMTNSAFESIITAIASVGVVKGGTSLISNVLSTKSNSTLESGFKLLKSDTDELI